MTQGLLQKAVAEFEAAVTTRDGDGAMRALHQIRSVFTQASDEEVRSVGPQIARILPEVPQGPAGLVALILGATVERGANALACAPPILAGARSAVDHAAEFCRRWTLSEGEEFPEPDMGDPPQDVIDRAGGIGDPTALGSVLGWWTLPQWEQAAIAVLSDKAVRQAHPADDDFVESVGALVEASGVGQCLLWGLSVLDDERLVALHRPSGRGFEFVMSGVAENFQLHTLLAAHLVSPGHVPGHAPTSEAVNACYGTADGAPAEYNNVGSFNLVSPSGEWIWNEGTPRDIPVIDGVRLLILDPPPYERSWRAGRVLPRMTAEFELVRKLERSEVDAYMSLVSPPVELVGPVKPSKRGFWRRRR